MIPEVPSPCLSLGNPLHPHEFRKDLGEDSSLSHFHQDRRGMGGGEDCEDLLMDPFGGYLFQENLPLPDLFQGLPGDGKGEGGCEAKCPQDPKGILPKPILLNETDPFLFQILSSFKRINNFRFWKSEIVNRKS